MTREHRVPRSALTSGLLLFGLVGLLLANCVLVRQQPWHLFTPERQAAANYSDFGRISQEAPTWNILTAEGAVEGSALLRWANRVRAVLAARQEKRQRARFTVYDLDFRSDYHLVFPGPEDSITVQLVFPFPSGLDTLHQVVFLVDGEEPLDVQHNLEGIRWHAKLQAGEERQISIGYRAHGSDSFRVALQHDRRSDVDVQIAVLGLQGGEVPPSSLPATAQELDGGGETFVWQYAGLVANRDVELTLPATPSPAQRIAEMRADFYRLAGLAPLWVGLYLATLAAMLHWSGARLRLVHYLLIGWALGFFYPMLIFLSGAVGVGAAASLAVPTISGLVLCFLGLEAGWRQTWWRAGWLLIVFLVILSLGTLTPWTALALIMGGLLILGTLMLSYACRPISPPSEPTVAPGPTPAEAEARPRCWHCPYCGRTLADDFDFCPGCGQDIDQFDTCANCGYQQFVSPDPQLRHCTRCGEQLR